MTECAQSCLCDCFVAPSVQLLMVSVWDLGLCPTHSSLFVLMDGQLHINMKTATGCTV